MIILNIVYNSLKIFINFMSTGVLPTFMSMHVCCSTQGDQKRALDPIELELPAVVRDHAGAGN